MAEAAALGLVGASITSGCSLHTILLQHLRQRGEQLARLLAGVEEPLAAAAAARHLLRVGFGFGFGFGFGLRLGLELGSGWG